MIWHRGLIYHSMYKTNMQTINPVTFGKYVIVLKPLFIVALCVAVFVKWAMWAILMHYKMCPYSAGWSGGWEMPVSNSSLKCAMVKNSTEIKWLECTECCYSFIFVGFSKTGRSCWQRSTKITLSKQKETDEHSPLSEIMFQQSLKYIPCGKLHKSSSKVSPRSIFRYALYIHLTLCFTLSVSLIVLVVSIVNRN